jgi:hypothetical protein
VPAKTPTSPHKDPFRGSTVHYALRPASSAVIIKNSSMMLCFPAKRSPNLPAGSLIFMPAGTPLHRVFDYNS